MRSSAGRKVGAVVRDPETGYWREAKDVPVVGPRVQARLDRERRFREALPEEAGALVLSCYLDPLSRETGRREFQLGERIVSTTDIAAALLERGLYPDPVEPETLAPGVNDFLVGHGFRLRSYPRDLGLGNQSPNRPDPRAQAQRRTA